MNDECGMLAGMAPENTIPVIDFRRHSMALQWNTASGTWSPCNGLQPLVHGIALIRASQPNICLYGYGEYLYLQIGANRYAMAENSPRIICTRVLASFGFRRRFTIKSSDGGVLYSFAYWTNQHQDFFHWLAIRAADPEWRIKSGRQWSEGLEPAALRAR